MVLKKAEFRSLLSRILIFLDKLSLLSNVIKVLMPTSKPLGPTVELKLLGDRGVIVGWNVYTGNSSKFYSLHGVDPKGVATSWIGEIIYSFGVITFDWLD